MLNDKETIIITDISGASEEEIIQELYKRYTNFVLIYEREGKLGTQAQNGIRYFGMMPSIIGLCQYALMRLSKQLEREIADVDRD